MKPTNHSNPSASARTAPTPTRASIELRDQAAVDAHGFNLDLAHARIVLTALSWLIASDGSKTRAVTGQMLRAMVIAGSQAIVRYGVEDPAPHPGLPQNGWSDGPVVLRQLGLGSADLTAYWRNARDRADDACMPLEWAIAFVPARFWPVLATFIGWGPDEAFARMRHATITMASQVTTRKRRRRPQGAPLAANTIRSRITATWKLMDCLMSLRTHIKGCPAPTLDVSLLEAWTHKPKRIDVLECGARESEQDNSGPPLEECVSRLKELAAELAAARPNRRYFALRRVVLLSLLVLHGSRVDALRTARIGDYLPDFVFADGVRQPALRIFPAKTWRDDQPHYLALPAQLAEWLHAWIEASGQAVGQVDAPLFPRSQAKKGREQRFMTQAGFYSAIAGDPRTGRPGTRALLARESDPCQGWHPHAFRHTSYQLALRAGAQLKDEHSHEFAHVHVEEFAKALAAHKMDGSVSATYRDVNRQQLARAVVGPMWEILWGDGLVRKGLDTRRIGQLRTQIDALRLTIRTLQDQARLFTIEAENASARAVRAREQDTKMRLLLEANHHHQMASSRRDDRARYEHDLTEAERRLDATLETLIDLPDDVSDGAYESQLAEALGTPVADDVATADVLADEITPRDFADVMGTTEQAINRWFRDGAPTSRPSPWLPGSEPWRVYTKKRKRIRVDAIDQARLTDAQKQRLLHIRQQRALRDGDHNLSGSPS
jgi:integrase